MHDESHDYEQSKFILSYFETDKKIPFSGHAFILFLKTGVKKMVSRSILFSTNREVCNWWIWRRGSHFLLFIQMIR
jgi:hypothetical protein